ncbi:MAG: sugar phosphate isomerase/epimerase [Candidatus Atribacteria bacterium]|jgi:xylose isomerase|nr:sugar phosphate isomerase/epimerase [Candidatus Atribacteria bacterium]
MDYPVKQAAISSFLSKTKDRFHEYNEDKTLEERFKIVSEIEGMDGMELVFPYEVNNSDELKILTAKYKINIAAINVNVKAEPEFRNGGLTSNKKEIRAKAVQFIKDAKDFAKKVGANKVTCCPLGDGYEFNFNCNYAQSWKYLVDTFGESASYLPEIPLFIEYKPAETRGRCFIDTAAKTLCLLNEIGNEQMGVTIDFGHSVMFGNENPAEVVTLIAESPFPFYIHINDNNGQWDWDYFAGTKHFLDYVEFLYYLQVYNYNDYITSDTSPTRWDIKGTFEANARITNKLCKLLNNLNRKEFNKLISGEDYLKTWKFIEKNIFSL